MRAKGEALAGMRETPAPQLRRKV